MKTLSFIGTGNMGGALLAAAARGMETGSICITDRDAAKAAAQAEAYGCRLAEDNTAAAAAGDYVMLCVKPQVMPAVARELAPILKSARQAGRRQVIVTIAPGKTLEWLEAEFGKPLKIIRTMPNTPAMVGEGITAVCPNEQVRPEMLDMALEVLGCCGKTEVVPEYLLDAVVAVSGSAPAYVFLFIEAMADAAVAEGMPRNQAYSFAAQAVLGSAKMVLDTGKHPGELKDMVCSPGGTTIEAVQVLEETGFRSSVMQAMRACAEKSRSI